MTSILTGDIINSRNVATHLWLPILKDAFNTVGTSPKTWEIFRGDSFQIEINSIENALLFAIKLKTALKKIKNLDVRIAIGIGAKNEAFKNITEGNGEAFINSGFAFDNILKKQNLAFKTPWPEFDNILNTALALALLTMDNWTINSATFVEMYLNKPTVTQKIIAKELNISESSASERRKRAGLDEILQLEQLYRTLINQKTVN
ncbi:transcriptional regulator [Polaribacter reichenbachii]|uniref:Transcriptional regulator n=1 Tax=Polaribacter reichenbachii TaxID=996801 RepID=A0A1B8U1B2_9FLAO|nr:transcriptional regulator [Polaribacter reichenbachii]APZ47212.1 transcriptional regulator [Polaribacter reichenbachii]AUC17853.1 transcriptional regulator [Polaribacter reichenbachii]OBY65656.1 transcriptional regulator [Polaribacter reichenbachii]